MRYRIFCCTRPRTGSLDSHTCVASYAYHSRNICGKFKNRRRRESFSFQWRAEIKRSILARTRLKHAFFPKIRHIPLARDTCDIKNGRKQVKKFGQPWLTLTVQFSYVFQLLLFLRACQAKELPVSLTLFFFFHCFR